MRRASVIRHKDANFRAELKGGPPSKAAAEARERFERHIGAIDLGQPTGADNESIDADLAREYAAKHDQD